MRHARRPLTFLLSLTTLALAGCPSPEPETPDTGVVDADAGRDSGVPADTGVDSGMPDAGNPLYCGGTPEECAIEEIIGMMASTCARRGNGDVICWGRGEDGELGDDRMTHVPGCRRTGDAFVTDCSSRGVLVALPGPALELEAGMGEACAVVGTDRQHYCWGHGGFTIGTTAPQINYAPLGVPLLTGAVLSDAHSFWCWLDAAGAPFCMGSNGRGQLGNGGTMSTINMGTGILLEDVPAPSPLADHTVVELEVGRWSGTACARTVGTGPLASAIYCWGTNVLGTLGDGMTSSSATTHYDCGSGTSREDCSWYGVEVGVLNADEVADLAIGFEHVCALVDPDGDGQGGVWCWGANEAGQLGLPDLAPRYLPTELVGLTDIVQIDAIADNTCALHADGTISCWGRSNLGQVGDGLDTHRPDCGTGTLFDCQPAPVTVSGIDDATYIAMGLSHACAIRASGEVWCWGNNEFYQTGDSSTPSTTDPIRLSPVRVPFLP